MILDREATTNDIPFDMAMYRSAEHFFTFWCGKNPFARPVAAPAGRDMTNQIHLNMSTS